MMMIHSNQIRRAAGLRSARRHFISKFDYINVTYSYRSYYPFYSCACALIDIHPCRSGHGFPLFDVQLRREQCHPCQKLPRRTLAVANDPFPRWDNKHDPPHCLWRERAQQRRQHLFGKEIFDSVVDSIDGFGFKSIEGRRRDLENVEKSAAYDKRIECCPISTCC